MKRLFTLMSALSFSFLGAQAQDASAWSEGQDVTDQLEWQNPSGQDPASSGDSDYGDWLYAGSDSHAYDYQEWEMYNNAAGAETYQVCYLPAGVYTFKLQGFYRGDYQTSYWEGSESINAVYFAESVTLNDTGGVAEVTRSQQVNLASIASSERSAGRIFTSSEWTNDVEYTYNNVTYYVPNCMEGTRMWFDAGYYDDNDLTVIQLQDGYIKVGVRKTATLASDWVIFSNFRAIYEGDATEAVELQVARDEFDKVVSQAEKLEEQFSKYPALGAYYTDALGELTDQYDAANTKEELEDGTAAVSALVSEYQGYYSSAKTLTTLVQLGKADLEASDYPGKSAFETAIAEAEQVEQDGSTSADFVTTSGADYSAAATKLVSARTEYIMSNGSSADGSYDFLSIVAYPFFCLPQYNPAWNEETQRWESTSLVLDGDGTSAGWSDVGESSDGDNCTYTTTTRVRIADGLTIGSDTTSVYSWYQTNTTGYVPYFNHKLSSAKQWSLPGERREIAQNLIGLPSGFYSLKGMGITWTGDWGDDNPCDMGIYMQSGGKRVTSSEDTYKSGWWDYNRDDWTTYTTGMIEVTDGTARVAFFANGFSAFTGMQLIYYGENPDFSSMVTTRMAEVKADAAELLILGGDQTYVSDLLATVPSEVIGFDAYEAALDTINKAASYITTASDYLNANDPTQLYSVLLDSCDAEDQTTIEIIFVAQNKTFDVYAGPSSTYTDVEALMADYDAYDHYMNTVKSYQSNEQGNEKILSLIGEQQTYLTANYADAAQLEAYEKALEQLHTQAVFDALDLTNASESNPVDITTLIKNASFTEGSTAWDGDITVDETLENAERYSTDFDISQTIYGLPAGAYRVEVQSFYRDGGMEDAYKHARYEEDGGYQPNVELYANEKSVSVVSIANEDANFTDRSFTSYTFTGTDPTAEEGEEEQTLTAWMEETSETNDETGETTYTVTSYKQEFDLGGNVTTVDAGEAWIYDAWYTDGDTRFFFPNSMRGAAARFANDGGAYLNSVEIMLDGSTDLTIGLRKSVTIDADWCLFDNFRLYYLGTETPVAILSATSSATAREYYSIDGRKLAAPQRGVNILRMSDGTVRKVLVK